MTVYMLGFVLQGAYDSALTEDDGVERGQPAVDELSLPARRPSDRADDQRQQQQSGNTRTKTSDKQSKTTNKPQHPGYVGEKLHIAHATVLQARTARFLRHWGSQRSFDSKFMPKPKVTMRYFCVILQRR